ncbi:LuxR C-terminal-related transcriptional regulator [Microbacterium ureisolvens]|uniref:LuxR C-terminal-related transcriptional regulator n=1 Tax=Microbacterium ureisolvens TaxID=2781186 RepID=UPI003642247C
MTERDDFPLRALHRASEIDDLRLPGGTVRAVVSGTAGSGKTTLLRRVARLLAEEGTEVAILGGDADPAAIPEHVVLLVDDAHLLSARAVTALAMRAENPAAGLVATLRPCPLRADVGELTRRLEQDRPALVLDDLRQVRPDAIPLPDPGPCGRDILRRTGGIPWLVRECLDAHDPGCTDPSGHSVLELLIRPRIHHRVMSAPPDVRGLVEELSLGTASATRAADGQDEASALVAEAYAEGLLSSDGRPAPSVAAAIRALAPASRWVEVIRCSPSTALRDERLFDGLDGRLDERIAASLIERGRTETHRDPALADALLARAVSCGADPSALAVERARTSWELGRLDESGVLLDALLRSPDASPAVVDLAAAVWAERGMMSLAAETYRASSADAAVSIRARVASAAAGRVPPPPPPVQSGPPTPPSTLRVADDLLDRGLMATLRGAEDGLPELQGASELYTAAVEESPSVELPAVIAAAAAIGEGDLKTAQTIVDDAVKGPQAGERGRSRLELWAAWIALQREHPAEARAALERAVSGRPLGARDDAMAATLTIGLARRYDDTAGLGAAWEAERSRISRIEPDLFTLLPLAELVIASARLGRAETMQPAFDRALRIVADLGDPPVWAAPLHWAGIQRGILLNNPGALTAHARALVAAAPHNRLAAQMARAGKVWTSVLSGAVDAGAVEEAARGLAVVGFAWDGARLAGHGASRSEDRRTIARLLACARELHPREAPRAADDATGAAPADTAGSALSEREREVAELVLQGKTYAEIGAAMFISPRTAEHHIAHIRRRLEATSRSDLLSKLRIAIAGSAGVAEAVTG